MRIGTAAIAAILGACGYGASFDDCTILCSEDTGCPTGLRCGDEGLCRRSDQSSCNGPACNSAIDLGPITALAPFMGTTRVAATATPAGLVVTYITAAGLTAVTVDLPPEIVWREGDAPTSHGPETSIASNFATNVHGVALTDRLVFAGVPEIGVGTAIAIVDLQLAQLVASRVEPDVVANSPENSTASDDDRVIIVGATGNTAQIVKLDRDGAKLFGSSYTLANAFSGSVAALGGDRYIGGWYTSTAACIVRVFDGALATTAMLDLAETCERLRVASNGPRIGLAWITGAGIQAMTGDPALSAMTPVVNLMATRGSPRITSTTDGFWVLSADSSGLRVGLLTLTGDVGATMSLSPYDGSLFPYDVVTARGVAYAVWASPAASPHLYLERLCR